MRPETINLISNVSLSEIGWRKRVYVLIFIDCLCKAPLTYEELKKNCKDSMGSLFNESDFAESVNYGITNKQVLFNQNIFSISEQKKTDLQDSHLLRIKAEDITKTEFINICKRLSIPEIDWGLFRDYFIIENIKVFILDGRDFESLFEEFISKLPESLIDKPKIIQIRSIVESLIQTSDSNVRNYLLSYIHGYYNIESLGLPEKTIDSLRPNAGKTYNIALLLDTNYVLSILQLHENPANELVNSISEICKKLNGKISISYHIHPRTIKEFQNTLDYEIKKLSNIKFNIPIAKAIATSASTSGFLKQFAIKYLASNGKLKLVDYTEPYLNSLSEIFKNFGIKIYNSLEEDISTSSSFKEDLIVQTQKNKKLKEDRQRSDKSIEHDLLLWHTVNNSRRTECDSFLEAKIWIATIDYRFVSFDKNRNRRIPICLEPSKILDFLQIWLPRDEIINEQLLNIIRIPLYSHEFIKEAEEATTKIISLISRFTSAEGLSEETIHKLLLNKTLREKIVSVSTEEEELKLISDNLLLYIDESNKENEKILKEKKMLQEIILKKENKEVETEALVQKLKEDSGANIANLHELEDVVKNIQHEKESLKKNVDDLQKKVDDKENLIIKTAKWEEKWSSIVSQWYHFPLVLLVIYGICYFCGTYLLAAINNTTKENIDLKTIFGILPFIILILQLLNFNKLIISFNLIFNLKSFKEKHRIEFMNSEKH